MRITLPSPAVLLKEQAIYISLSAIAAGIFWAMGQQVNPLIFLVYSLSIGNLTARIMENSYPLYWGRRFPYDWLAFAATLAVVLIPVYVISAALVYWIARPTDQPLRQYLLTGWRFPILFTAVFSIGVFLYEVTKKRLEERNQELQQSLAQGTAQLQQQEEELRRAREIQQSLLPKEIPQLPGFEVAGAWRPALAVSGDYYDVFPLGDHRLCICIADVVGKGVSAALLMAHAQAAVRALSSQSDSPAILCARVNKLLCENLATGKFVTFFYGILDGENRTLEYCNAGHPNPILLSRGQSRVLDKSGAVLGVFPNWPYENGSIPFESQDRLLLFTDGITEAEGVGAEEFGEENIAAYAQANRRKSAREMTNGLLSQVNTFCGGRFQDDATLVVIAAN
jgi:sigma-B regulation protein RsbU (phosphoserine phosphatase)